MLAPSPASPRSGALGGEFLLLVLLLESTELGMTEDHGKNRHPV
jgi:hypothetical protein